LSTVGTRSLFVGLSAIVIAIILTTTGPFPPNSGGPYPSDQASTSVASIDGLQLSLEISASRLLSGGSIVVNVSETNTNATPLNQSAARSWAVSGLRTDGCYASIYPFGVAIYYGHYTAQNISSGSPLNLFPALPCPLFIRYVSGYYFQQHSDLAVVLPGNGPPVAMASGFAARGNYTHGTTLQHFSPGMYTVVAGDEWGSLAFLYFVVA
jgi:hypothetical protein